MTDSLARWEKWPVAALFLAGGLYLMEWYAGPRLAIPADWMTYVSTLGGIAAMVAVDGAMIATVAGMRQGRRGVWSVATILMTALFAGGVALVLHGALPAWVGAWLHAGFVATIAAYLLHLAQPRATAAQTESDAAHLRAELAQREVDAAQAAEESARLAAELAQTAAELTQARAELEQARAGAALDPLTLARQLLDIGVSSRKVAQIVGMSDSTLRGRLKALTNGHAVAE